MMPEERLARLESQHSAVFRMLRRLASQELSHRSLILAILDQPVLNLQRLEEDYEAYLLRALEQIHPDQRDPGGIELFSSEIRNRIPRPS